MPPPRVTIDELPEQTIVEDTNLIVVQDAGVTKKMSMVTLRSMPSTPLNDHLNDPTDAHDASAISATPSGEGVDGINVQVQLGQLAALVNDLAGDIAADDDVWVGTDEPTDPETELWWDTDEPDASLPSTGDGDFVRTVAAGDPRLNASVARANLALYDVRWSGAIPDGTTDSTTAITNAVAAAVAGGWKGVVFPGGTGSYLVSAGIAFTGLTDFTFAGDGTIKQTAANLTIFGFTGCDRITIRELAFTGLIAAGSIGGRGAIVFDDSVAANHDVIIDSIHIDTLGTSGIALDGVQGATLSNLVIRRTAEHAIYVSNGCVGVSISNLVASETGYQSATTGITAASTCALKIRAQEVHLNGFSFSALNGIGVLFESDVPGSVYSKKCTVAKGTIAAASSVDAIRFAQGVEDCLVDHVVVSSGNVGVRDSDSIRCTVSHCTFTVTTQGYNSNGSSGPTNFLGDANTYVSCSSHAISQTNAGSGCRHRNPTILSGVVGNVAVPAGVTVDIKPGLLAPTFAASYTPPSLEYDTIAITLTANISIAAIAVSILGRRIRFALTQDATGGWTTSWSSAFKRPSLTPTTTAGTRTVYEYVCIATNVWALTSYQTGLSA